MSSGSEVSAWESWATRYFNSIYENLYGEYTDPTHPPGWTQSRPDLKKTLDWIKRKNDETNKTS
jgi:hypothetical protein